MEISLPTTSLQNSLLAFASFNSTDGDFCPCCEGGKGFKDSALPHHVLDADTINKPQRRIRRDLCYPLLRELRDKTL